MYIVDRLCFINRVRHRERLEQQKLLVLEQRKEELAQQEYEKQCRLEALREKVRVVAEVDPYRLVKDTEVSFEGGQDLTKM